MQLFVSSADHATQVIRIVKKLRAKEGCGSVYISIEGRDYKKIVEEVKQKRTAEPHKVHIITKDNNIKIVSLEK